MKISPEIIKEMSVDNMNNLAGKIRNFLLTTVSKNGGHLASNLGVVELTIALHHVFSTPSDKIVWDVGHQSYVHKIITGRAKTLTTTKSNGGVSGFPRREESEHDAFNTGHSSTSVSAALGIAKAMELAGNTKNRAIAVIGDGAMTGGMAFEALNQAGLSDTNLVVVLNDNQMSICENVGAISRYLNRFRTKTLYNNFKKSVDFTLNKIPKIGTNVADTAARIKGAIRSLVLPTTIFEELGFKYIGPIDGHNIDELLFALNYAKNYDGPILVHTITTKGKGYDYAENHPDRFHDVPHFDIYTGKSNPSINGNLQKTSEIFGNKLYALAETNEKIIAITPAMTKGTGLELFRTTFPERFFDVGITEPHSVTFAAGLATEGLRPFVATYSSFFQRAYDQILHDVALQNLPVVFAISSTGLHKVGETHHGIFDLTYLSNMPNMSILAPSSTQQLSQMLEFAVSNEGSPVAIRYPKMLPIKTSPFKYGKSQIVQEGKDISIFCIGDMLSVAIEASSLIPDISPEIIDIGTIRPLDIKTLKNSASKTKKVITLETNCKQNGAGTLIQSTLGNIAEFRVMGFDAENFPQFENLEDCGLDPRSIATAMKEMCYS